MKSAPAITLLLTLVWNYSVISAEPGFDEALEFLLSERKSDVPSDIRPQREARNKLIAAGTKVEIRDALRRVLADPSRQDRWQNAIDLWTDYAFNLSGNPNAAFDELIAWARLNLRNVSLQGDSNPWLFSRLNGLFRQLGSMEDVALVRAVADGLPASHARQKDLLRILADDLPAWVKMREDELAKAKSAGHSTADVTPIRSQPVNPLPQQSQQATERTSDEPSKPVRPPECYSGKWIAWSLVIIAAASGVSWLMRKSSR